MDDDPIGETAQHTPEDWTEKREYTQQTPWGARQEPEEPRYLGLTGSQFNLAFFLVLGVIAVAAFLFLGGVSAVKDLTGDDGSAPETTTTRSDTPSDTVPAAGSGDTVSAVLDTFEPFSLMSTLGSQPGAPSGGGEPSGGAGDDALKAALLQEGDLPAGFSSFGEMSFTLPVEGSSGTMAANMFARGDLAAGDFGAMVMSAALEGPPGAMGDFDQMTKLSEDDLAEMEAAVGQFGMTFNDFRLLDASGLGEGGMGMHLAMDFGGMFEQFGLPAEETPPFDAIVMEMYAFAKGERVYMVMVVWPEGADPGVNSRSLADAVNARAD
ncbi:MAG TPA: hypothetical protein VJN32_05585 [Dehalococcoidia bacterium]|nr:hypothetical protein [Dehalococcoidia bacterium]